MQKQTTTDKNIDKIIDTITGNSIIAVGEYKKLVISNSGAKTCTVKVIQDFNGSDIETTQHTIASKQNVTLDYSIDKLKFESENTTILIIAEK